MANVFFLLLQRTQPKSNRTPEDEDGALAAVAEQHLDGVGQALLLVEGGLLAVEVVELHPVELGGVPERLLRPRQRVGAVPRYK